MSMLAPNERVDCRAINEPWFGWRCRIGLVCVDSSPTIEGEFRAMAPAGVSIHSTRIFLRNATVAGLDSMRKSKELERCCELLTAAKVESIVYGGTSVSFLSGPKCDEELIRRMKSASKGIPCTTATTAVVRALKAMKLKRIAVATPYIPEIDKRLVKYFTAAGFDILSIKGQGFDDVWKIYDQTPEAIHSFVKSADHPKAEAVFVSCGDYRVGPVTEALEADLGKPVIGAIQASYWDVKRLAGLRASTEGFGTLLREF